MKLPGVALKVSERVLHVFMCLMALAKNICKHEKHHQAALLHGQLSTKHKPCCDACTAQRRLLGPIRHPGLAKNEKIDSWRTL